MSTIPDTASQLSDLFPLCSRLPSASVDQLIAATKIVSRAGGRMSVRSFATELTYDDEFLAGAVEFLAILGLTEVGENEIALTTIGKQIATAGISSRRRLFSEQVLRLPIIRKIVDTIAGQPGRSVPRNTLMEQLGAQSCVSDPDRIFDHVLAWGRYARLFSYDEASGLLSLA